MAVNSGKMSEAGAGGSGTGVGSLTKYKQRIAMYEAADNPLAPLTGSQRQFILDLTHGASERPIPKHLRSIPVKKTVEVLPAAEDSLKGINFEKFDFQRKQEFNKWFAEVERDVREQEDQDVIQYIDMLEDVQKQMKDLLDQTSSALDDLKGLEDNYHFVANKTNSLHVSCQQLIEEQKLLEVVAKDIEENLSHFLQLEKVASKLSVPSLLVISDAFFTILDQIDTSLSFMVHNPSFKDSSVYTAKFKHCLNRAVSLIKSEVHKTLQETTSQINLAVIQQNIQPSSVTSMSSSAEI